MKSTLFIILVTSIVLNALFIGFIFKSEDQNFSTYGIDTDRKNFQYLSPRIFIENQHDLIINFIPLRSSLQKYINQQNSRVGMYFEYLPTGNSIGVNEKEGFVPASLLKLPLAMGVFRNFENGRLKPDQIVILREELKDPRFGILWKEKNGSRITVKKALNYLLTFSDNTAQEIILDLLTGVEIDRVFDALDIPKSRDTENHPMVTAKNYTSILKCLYLSCYLTKESSNDLLDILTKTYFKDKLPAGVPESIQVAHKIGVREGTNENHNIYTDCGIVYYPKRPYALCVMVEGTEDKAREIIKEISRITYEFIRNVN